VDLMHEGGIAKQRWSISDTAEFGDYVSGPRVVTDQVKADMKAILADIQDGSFAKKFIDDQDAGAPEFTKLREDEAKHEIETVGKELRKMFSWSAQSLDDDYTEGSAARWAALATTRSPAPNGGAGLPCVQRRRASIGRRAGSQRSPLRRKASTVSAVATRMMPTLQISETSTFASPPPTSSARSDSTSGPIGWWVARGWSQEGIVSTGTKALERYGRNSRVKP